MNENKRLLMLFAVVAVIIVIILLISFWPAKDKTFSCGVKADGDYKKLGKVNYKQYQCLMESEDKNALVVAEDLSDEEKETINKTAINIGHAIYYIDTANIDSDDLKTIKSDLKYNDSSFEKDVIIVVENGKVSTFKEDVLTEADQLKEFLKEAKLAKFACDVQPDEQYENLGEITYDQYKCLYDTDEPFALVLAQTTCSYCSMYKPVINEYAGENNIPVYIVEIDKLSTDEGEALISSLEYFNDNSNWGTPLTLGIKNKEVIADIGGHTEDTSVLENFFKQLGLK